MTRVPGWWRADAPHWSSRTTALLSGLALLVGAVLGIVGRYEPQPGLTQPAQVLQPSPPVADAGSMCSADSEGSVLAGWGPDRATYHDDTLPPALTFNSTSDNGIYGDEPNFVRLKPVSVTPAGGWSDSVEVHDKQEYLVQAYARLDGPDSHSAKDTNLLVNLPTCTGHRVGVAAILSSLDAFLSEVWGGASFWSRSDFNLALVPDSGVVYSSAHPTGLPYSVDDLVTTKGISIGSRKLDGVFEPGYANSVYVSFRVRAQVAE